MTISTSVLKTSACADEIPSTPKKKKQSKTNKKPEPVTLDTACAIAEPLTRRLSAILRSFCSLCGTW